jgi:hypothetical protein
MFKRSINIDRGFQTMIPQAKEEEAQEPIEFQHNVEFSLFGRTFMLNFKVNKKQE